MKIFNFKRNIAIQKNKLKTYFLYAIGEIILVVIGLVIGLQLNDFSNQKIKQKKIGNYYSKINDEIDNSLELIDHNITVSYIIMESLTSCLESISKKEADSTFIKNFTSLSNNTPQKLYFPVIDEFMEQGNLSSIEDINLRENFRRLEYSIYYSRETDTKLRNFDADLLKSNYLKNINFLDISNYNTDNPIYKFDKINLENDFNYNYEVVFSDITLWNLIIFRMNIEKDVIASNKDVAYFLKEIKKQINNLEDSKD